MIDYLDRKQRPCYSVIQYQLSPSATVAWRIAFSDLYSIHTIYKLQHVRSPGSWGCDSVLRLGRCLGATSSPGFDLGLRSWRESCCSCYKFHTGQNKLGLLVLSLCSRNCINECSVSSHAVIRKRIMRLTWKTAFVGFRAVLNSGVVKSCSHVLRWI